MLRIIAYAAVYTFMGSVLAFSANAQTPPTASTSTISVSGEFGVKSARLRLDGGGDVANDGLAFSNATIAYDGYYSSVETFGAIRDRSDQVTLTVGKKFSFLNVNWNLYGQYWFLPKKDAYYLVSDTTKSWGFDNGDAFSLTGRIGRLQIFGQKQTWVFRGITAWNTSLLGLSVQISSGLNYRTDTDRFHIPVTGNIELFKLGNHPILLGGEAFFPLSKGQFAKAIVLSTKWTL